MSPSDAREAANGPRPSGPMVDGDGPVRLVLMHGWLEDSTSWDAVVARLDPATYSVCRVDARGYGRSSAVEGAYTLEEYAGDVVTALEELGWDQVVLVGHSMSGVGIQEVLLRAPQRIRALVGVAPVPAGGAGFSDELLGLFERAVTDSQVRGQILARSTGDRHPDAWVEAFVGRSEHATRAEAMHGYLHSWTRGLASERLPELGRVTLPVHVVVGAHDPSLNAARMTGTWAALYTRCAVHEISDAGHYPMHEATEVFTDELRQILETLPLPARRPERR